MFLFLVKKSCPQITRMAQILNPIFATARIEKLQTLALIRRSLTQFQNFHVAQFALFAFTAHSQQMICVQ